MREIPLSEVLAPAGNLNATDPSCTYPMLGVRSFGRGAFAAPDLSGAQTRYVQLRQVFKNQLVYPKLMAWEGAFDVVPHELDARWVSPEFVTFDLSPDIDPDYFRHFVHWDGFRKRIAGDAKGTNVRRRRLQPAALLAMHILLPGLPEQRRIAAHLDAVERRAHDIPKEGSWAQSATDAWLGTVFAELPASTSLGVCAEVTRGSTPHLAQSGTGIIGQACVRWGDLDLGRVKYAEESWAEGVPAGKRTAVGDLLLNSTGEGTLGRAALVRVGEEGLITDSKVLTIRPHAGVEAEFLALYLRSPQGRAAVEGAKGANTTKQTELGVKRAQELSVPEIPHEKQLRIIAGWQAVQPLLQGVLQSEQRRMRLVPAILPAARNEVFNQLR